MTPTRAIRLLRRVAAVGLLVLCAAGQGSAEGRSDERLDVAPVWSGHPVGFAFITHQGRQFVAFYDAQRRMTVAQRSLDADAWQLVTLPEKVGWDSHNSIVMTFDDDGYLHLSGNMHVRPLVYFRSTKPLDAATLTRVPNMVGQNETACTYPVFLRGANKELLFTYRDGRSGNGSQIYNVYDPRTRTWKRLLDKPLTDGQGKMNAYFNGPVRGPDGLFHLCWVWRNTPDCSTNHDLSYARSKDLVHWETGAGKPLALPITLETGEIVDPVPPKGGMINGNTKIGFDSRARPVITYHKFDAAGMTQVCNARLEEGRWKVYQASDWHTRWEFSGGGSIPFEVRLGAVQPEKDGGLSLAYQSANEGAGIWRLDEATLKPVGKVAPPAAARPPGLEKPESALPGMQVHWLTDAGGSGEPGAGYLLRWETLGPNRDRPREGEPPPPSMLRVYKARRG